MTSQHLIFLMSYNNGNALVTEIRQPLNQDKLTPYSWENKINIELNYWVLLAIPILVSLAFFIDLRKKYLAKKQKKQPQSLNFHCYECKYFNQNHYLKCAVNPLLALTKESSDCKDFEKNHRN